MTPSIVRSATVADENQLWVLLRLMHHEAGIFPLSEQKVQFYLDRVLRPETIHPGDTGPRGIIGVIGIPQRLEGIIMLVLGQIWYSDSITMMDSVNFVHPDYRQSSHAKTLLAYSKNMVDEIRKNHCDFRMMLGVVSSKRTAAKCRLYEQQLTQIGAFYVYPAPDDFDPLYETRKRLTRHEQRKFDLIRAEA